MKMSRTGNDNRPSLLTVRVTNLRLYANHGVMAQERVVGNEFSLSLELILKPEALKAAAADRLEGTVNYAEVIAVAREVMGEPSALLENVVWRLSRELLTRFPMIDSGRVTLTKLMPPCGVDLDGVTVELTF